MSTAEERRKAKEAYMLALKGRQDSPDRNDISKNMTNNNETSSNNRDSGSQINSSNNKSKRELMLEEKRRQFFERKIDTEVTSTASSAPKLETILPSKQLSQPAYEPPKVRLENFKQAGYDSEYLYAKALGELDVKRDIPKINDEKSKNDLKWNSDNQLHFDEHREQHQELQQNQDHQQKQLSIASLGVNADDAKILTRDKQVEYKRQLELQMQQQRQRNNCTVEQQHQQLQQLQPLHHPGHQQSSKSQQQEPRGVGIMSIGEKYNEKAALKSKQAEYARELELQIQQSQSQNHSDLALHDINSQKGPVPLLEANLNCWRKFSNLVPLLEGDLKNIICLLKI